ncbi:hypothetical protein LTR66_017808 [Elasticomyces elasticus]|nr:hypothetical protein LTR66_017808 [Elasticomyces elasticus]
MAAIKGVEQDGLEIPIIDFAAYRHGDAAQRKAVGDAIVSAYQQSGFIYLRSHGIASEEVASAFAHSAKFFTRSQDQKDQLAWTTPAANRGYVASGREKVTNSNDPEEIAKMRATNPDLKESMEIGREGEEEHPNEWPDRFGDASDKLQQIICLLIVLLCIHNQISLKFVPDGRLLKCLREGMILRPGNSFE